MKKHILITVVCAISALLPAFSQETDTLPGERDTLLLMSGKEITGKVIKEDSNGVVIKARKRKKLKEYMIEKYRIYSLRENGRETVLYEQDSSIGNNYTQKQMRYFIYGEQDANRKFKTPLTSVLGFSVGVGGGYLLSEGNILGIAPPMLFVAGAAIPGTKVRKKTVSNLDYLQYETYHKGYKREAKGKRVQNAIKSSLVGTLAGFLAFTLIGN